MSLLVRRVRAARFVLLGVRRARPRAHSGDESWDNGRGRRSGVASDGALSHGQCIKQGLFRSIIEDRAGGRLQMGQPSSSCV